MKLDLSFEETYYNIPTTIVGITLAMANAMRV